MQINDSMTAITGTADQTNQGAAAARESATELSTLAGRVQNLVTTFTY